MDFVTAEQLARVAAMAPQQAERQYRGSSRSQSRLLVEQWLRDSGIGFKRKSNKSAGRTVWLLDCCPINPSHTDASAVVMQDPAGKMSAKCQHNSCAEYGWPDFRDAIGRPRPEHFDPPLGSESSGSRNDDFAPNVICLGTIDPESISWHWKGWIAEGKCHLMAGRPGVGKSFFLCYLAARYSAGGFWPDGQKVTTTGEVLMLVGEDGLGDTIRPRIDDHGGDASKVFVWQSVRKKSDDPDGEPIDLQVQLSRDVAHLRKLLTNHPGIKVVLVDPLSEFIGGIDSHKNSDVRSMLGPIARLADEFRVAVIFVEHFRKSMDGPAMYQVMGSQATVAQARIAWAFGASKEDEKRILMLPLKNNIHARVPGWAYRIVDGLMEWEPDEQWITFDELMSDKPGPKPEKCREATDWLLNQLADGPVAVAMLKDNAENDEVSWRTLERAKQLLGVESDRIPGQRNYQWSLPDTAPSAVPNGDWLSDSGDKDNLADQPKM